MGIAWTLNAGDLRYFGRFDPDYFDPRVEEVSTALKRLGAQQLGSYVDSAGRGVSPCYDSAGTVRVIKTANVRRFEIAAAPAQFVSDAFTGTCRHALVPYGALLITGTGVGSAGRTSMKLDRTPMIADTHVTIVALKNILHAGYVCAYLQSPIGRQQLLRLRRGSSRQIEIYPEDILSVLVPPLTSEHCGSISRRWLAAARSVWRSTRCMAEAERRIEAYVELDAGWSVSRTEINTWTQGASVLIASKRIDAEYADPVIERLRDQVRRAGAVPLSELVLSVRKGVQPSRYVENAAIRVVKAKNVDYPELDLQACETTDEEGWPFYLAGGEVLLNATGEGTLGRAAVVPVGVGGSPMVPAVDLYVLEVDRSIVLPEYLALYLNSTLGRRLTASLQTGSSGQQHIYPEHFPLIPIPLPSTRAGAPDLDWQRRTVAIAARRVRALADAQHTAEILDEEFLSSLGAPVDLSVLPS